jgi:hypothetical protein
VIRKNAPATPNLPVKLPDGLAICVEHAEKVEPWVNRDTSFLKKQRELNKKLKRAKSRAPRNEFLKHFSTVAAFSSFRENLALMGALSYNHPQHLIEMLKTVKNKTCPEPAECWGAIRWRVRYAETFNILERVFSEERLELIKTALNTQDIL